MATKVHMEALSPTMEEGQIVQWLKNEGDEIAEGDVIAEIETDKATMELVARGAGVLRKQLLGAGSTAPVGSVIGVIAAADEDISEIEGAAGGGGAAAAPAEAEDAERTQQDSREKQSQPAEGASAEDADAGDVVARTTEAPEGAEREAAAAKPAAGPSAPAKPAAPGKPGGAARPAKPAPRAPAPSGNGGGEGERVKASPLARRMAAEAGMDLSSVQGSGPGGRIVRRDVEAAGAEAPSSAPAREAEAGCAARRAAPPVTEGDYEEIRVSQMRKTIAKRLVESIGPVPTFYLTIEVDMTRMNEVRRSLNERLAESGAKVSVNDLVIKATAVALRRHPEVNASWNGDVIRRYNRVHVGVAVAVEDGLITPIVRDADAKGAAEIAVEVRDLAGRARERKLQPDEYTGATFSVSNLGMFGIDEFTAIINPPEAGILAIGRIEEKPVFAGGRVVPQARMRITMSCDHRVIDGAMGAKFLQTLRSYLEEPMMMLA